MLLALNTILIDHIRFHWSSFSFRSTALSLAPEQTELCPWLSPVLVLPVLQLQSCLGLTEPLAERDTHRLNQELVSRLLRSISRPTQTPTQVTNERRAYTKTDQSALQQHLG